jgi:hypothetical protein
MERHGLEGQPNNKRNKPLSYLSYLSSMGAKW